MHVKYIHAKPQMRFYIVIGKIMLMVIKIRLFRTTKQKYIITNLIIP